MLASAAYTLLAFTRRLAAEGIVASMGTVSDALDNAMSEPLLETMKMEKLSKPEIICCLKRYMAREAYHLLTSDTCT